MRVEIAVIIRAGIFKTYPAASQLLAVEGMKTSFSVNPDDYKFRGIARKEDAEGKVYWRVKGPMLVPLEIDQQNDTAKHDDIEAQAYDWFVNSDHSQVDIAHKKQKIDAIPWQTYITDEGDSNYTPGSWVVAMDIYDPAIGAKIEAGELNGFSWSGPHNKEGVIALVSHPIEASGTTEISDSGIYPEHDHTIEALKFDDRAKPLPTVTGEAFGHTHRIVGATRTEQTDGHAHGLLIKGAE